MTMTEKLLAEFPPIETEQWEAAITADLKGASYAEKLIWRAPEGLAVRPYYRQEDAPRPGSPDGDWAGAAPGAFPFARGAHTQAGWRIREQVSATQPAEANREARSAVAAGADEISFSDVAVRNPSDLVLLLANLPDVPVHFAAAGESLLRLLLAFQSGRLAGASITTAFDPLTNIEFAAEILQSAPASMVPFTLDVAALAPADAAPPAQDNALALLGRALTAGIAFLDATNERNIHADRAAAALEFSFSLGSNYFFEIARLRAFRMLWARVVESFGGTRQRAGARIAARTAYPPVTREDSHWNILRATTQTMSAVLGGADAIAVAPFEEGREGEAARRLARNTQLLLRHEAGFARVADPGGGSYYLENLTRSIAAGAWKAMQDIEARGGFNAASNGKQREHGAPAPGH